MKQSHGLARPGTHNTVYIHVHAWTDPENYSRWVAVSIMVRQVCGWLAMAHHLAPIILYTKHQNGDGWLATYFTPSGSALDMYALISIKWHEFNSRSIAPCIM